jgi:hypothetical protein
MGFSRAWHFQKQHWDQLIPLAVLLSAFIVELYGLSVLAWEWQAFAYGMLAQGLLREMRDRQRREREQRHADGQWYG